MGDSVNGHGRRVDATGIAVKTEDQLYAEWVGAVADAITGSRMLSYEPEAAAELVDGLECPGHPFLGKDRARYGSSCFGECVIDKGPGSPAFIRFAHELLRASYAVYRNATDIVRDARQRQETPQ